MKPTVMPPPPGEPIILPAERIVLEVQESPPHGTVTDVWEEPMYDTIRVPAQLDPTGTYYRPSHKTVVEIRPGRNQEVEYPGKNQ